MIAEADLTLSYSDVELTVLESHLPAAKLGRVPWVVDVRGDAKPTFADTKDILFLGGFGHPPNVEAARFFVTEVMPELLAKDPSIVFHIVGSNPTKEVMDFASDSVKVHGYVPDLDAVLSSTRVFVAPLRSGAGIKGKVLESLSYGLAGVFSPIAIEGTGLSNELDCLVADEPRVWAAQVLRLYSDETLWERISTGAWSAPSASRSSTPARICRRRWRRSISTPPPTASVTSVSGPLLRVRRPPGFAAEPAADRDASPRQRDPLSGRCSGPVRRRRPAPSSADSR